MGAGIVAGLCCCTKGNPPIPDENQYYECEPLVCKEGFENCFVPKPSLWYVVFAPEDIELMVGEFEIDPETFKWVFAGQMWQCVRLLGSESEKPLEPYSDVRTVRVFPAFNTISDGFPADGAELLVMPDHRVSANNTGEVAQPTEENSLTLQRTSGDNTYITRFHMVNSFIHEMHNPLSPFRYGGAASIFNATPDRVSATLGNPDKAFNLVQYQIGQNDIGADVLVVASESETPFPEFRKPFDRAGIGSTLGSVALGYQLDLDSMNPFPPLPLGGYEPGEDYWLPTGLFGNFNVVFVSGERVRGIPHTDGVRNFMEGDFNECERFGPATYIPIEAFSEEGGNNPLWPPDEIFIGFSPTEEPSLTFKRTVRQLEVDSCKLLSTKTLKTEAESPACPTGSYVVFSVSNSGSAPKKGVQYFPPRTSGQLNIPAEIGTRDVRLNLFSVG